MQWSEIEVSAPVRVLDLGGWTDTWFAGRGLVTNVAVGPGVWVRITPADRTVVELASLGECHPLDAALHVPGHPVIEAIIRAHPVGRPVRIEMGAGVPPGSGLGTSAAVAVALLAGLRAATGDPRGEAALAAEAHALETGTGLQSGVQDHVAAAMGGASHMAVDYPHFQVTRLAVDPHVWRRLGDRLVTVYFGRPHRSSDIHHQVIAHLESADPQPVLEPLRQLALDAAEALTAGDLEALASVLRRSVEAQRALDPRLICDDTRQLIVMCRDTGGAVKVNGAGGDGGSATVLLPADEGAAAQLEQRIASVPAWRRLDLRPVTAGVEVTSR